MEWCRGVMCSYVEADGIVSLYLCCTAGVAMTCTGFEWLSVRLTSGHPGRGNDGLIF